MELSIEEMRMLIKAATHWDYWDGSEKGTIGKDKVDILMSAKRKLKREVEK
jgi:hypothetical protein